MNKKKRIATTPNLVSFLLHESKSSLLEKVSSKIMSQHLGQPFSVLHKRLKTASNESLENMAKEVAVAINVVAKTSGITGYAVHAPLRALVIRALVTRSLETVALVDVDSQYYYIKTLFRSLDPNLKCLVFSWVRPNRRIFNAMVAVGTRLLDEKP